MLQRDRGALGPGGLWPTLSSGESNGHIADEPGRRPPRDTITRPRRKDAAFPCPLAGWSQSPLAMTGIVPRLMRDGLPVGGNPCKNCWRVRPCTVTSGRALGLRPARKLRRVREESSQPRRILTLTGVVTALTTAATKADGVSDLA